MKYWTSMLKGSTEDQSMTKETQTAMIFNLTRVARTFGESDPKSCGECCIMLNNLMLVPASLCVTTSGVLTTLEL